MEEKGYAVLDLEKIAAHRGSLLGDEPDHSQPSQRWFEAQILTQLEKHAAEKTVHVESESKRIGKLRCPESLWTKMLAAPVCEMQAPMSARVTHLLREYDHFQHEPTKLITKLQILKGAHSKDQVNEWQQLIYDGDWAAFVTSLLEKHYDPSYRRCANFAAPTSHLIVDEVSAAGFARADIERLFSLTSGVAVG
jgi:tRNA 2-selenouridine synthase